jgi:hypothetical protein
MQPKIVSRETMRVATPAGKVKGGKENGRSGLVLLQANR